MNSKLNSIEILPAVIPSARGTYQVGPRVISLVFEPPVQFDHAVSLRKAGAPLVPFLPDQGRGELWETLSYGILWLSGLMGIGLCFV
jgi:hypothetical protein